MMARMLTQVPLPLLPGDAAEIAPGVGVVAGPDGGGVVWVHGLATFAWDAGDEAGRRLAAVQLHKLKAATQAQVADAFGVIPVSVWRWDRALAAGGVAGLVPGRKGPRRASKLTPQVVARIRELDGQGAGKAGIAAAAGVSESSVRNALRPASAGAGGGEETAGAAGRTAGQGAAAGEPAPQDEVPGEEVPAAGEPGGGEGLPVLPDPVPRDGERALARCSRRARGTRWPGCCRRCSRPGWRAAPARFTGGCGTGFTTCRPCSSCWCSWRCCASRAPRAPPASPQPRWAGYLAWTGPRRSRRSAASWASSRPAARASSCRWRWPATTPPPARTSSGSCI